MMAKITKGRGFGGAVRYVMQEAKEAKEAQEAKAKQDAESLKKAMTSFAKI